MAKGNDNRLLLLLLSLFAHKSHNDQTATRKNKKKKIRMRINMVSNKRGTRFSERVIDTYTQAHAHLLSLLLCLISCNGYFFVYISRLLFRYVRTAFTFGSKWIIKTTTATATGTKQKNKKARSRRTNPLRNKENSLTRIDTRIVLYLTTGILWCFLLLLFIFHHCK